MVADEPRDPLPPISPNPYIVGNPIRDRAKFFGREAEFELVRKRFQHSASGGLLVFCGERRSGKTSILFQIVDGRLGPDFVPVLVDMQSMAINDETGFLARLAREVKDALGEAGTGLELPVFEAGTNRAAVFHAFIERVLEVHASKKLILLFDEYELFENKIDAGILGEDVLHILSSLIEGHSVFLVFTGSQHLEARRRDYWRILGKSLYRTISYLQRDDAERLIRRPVEGQAEYDDDAVDGICRLTAGQPFYTQAICQGVVDLLNERHTRRVTHALLGEVVAGIVENPLPQMIFLWDSLERDEKLVLALLAESLPEAGSASPAATLGRLARRRHYPLELGRARLATVLERLFGTDFLAKADGARGAAYNFRMDMWRLWIRRMHSVWQVVREEGLPLQRTGPDWNRVLRFIAVAGGLLVLGFLVMRAAESLPDKARTFNRTETPSPMGGKGWLDLSIVPQDAVVTIDGAAVGRGGFHGRLDPAEHRVQAEAADYAETTMVLRLGSSSDTREIRMRALVGALRVETNPPGALVTLDGSPRGRSPVLIPDVAIRGSHQVEASLPGRVPAREQVVLEAASLRRVRLTLGQANASAEVTSEPSGAHIFVDGMVRGSTPLRLDGLGAGRHRLEARSDGFAAADTSLELAAGGALHFVLHPESPGVLVVQGDYPSQIYVDDALLVENVQNSGPRRLRAGVHQVRVVLMSGEVVERNVTLRPGERAVFDYTRNSVESAPDIAK